MALKVGVGKFSSTVTMSFTWQKDTFSNLLLVEASSHKFKKLFKKCGTPVYVKCFRKVCESFLPHFIEPLEYSNVETCGSKSLWGRWKPQNLSVEIQSLPHFKRKLYR